MTPNIARLGFRRVGFALPFLVACLGSPTLLRAEEYAVGADVSFLPQAEQKGIVFKENGQPKPGLQIFKDHGYNWIRLRLFHTPTQLPNDLAYTIAAAKDAKQLGFKFLLDFHYSDTWADPAKQFTPKAWEGMSHDQLVDAVFAYTRDTIAAFREAGVQPDMVQIGNEVIGGMIWPDGRLPQNWDHFADLLKAGIRGVDAGRGDGPRPQIMIHIDRGGDKQPHQGLLRPLQRARRRVRRHRPVLLSLVARQPGRPARKPGVHGQYLRQRHHRRRSRLQLATRPNTATAPARIPKLPKAKRNFSREVNEAVLATPGHHGKGVFWWEPAVSPSPIASRGMFDNDGNALPVITVFDDPAARGLSTVAKESTSSAGN